MQSGRVPEWGRERWCVRHGGDKRKQCKVVGCTSQAKRSGVCVRHGADVKQCSVEGCTSQARVAGGLCRKHGARECSVEGCTSKAKVAGRCKKHRNL